MEQKIGNLLIVDKDSRCRESLKIICKPFFEKILTEQIRENLLKTIQTQEIDVIILNVDTFTDHDEDIFADLKKYQADAEVIMFAHSSSQLAPQLWENLEISAFLLKPFKLTRILWAISKAIRKKVFYNELKKVYKQLKKGVLLQGELSSLVENIILHHFDEVPQEDMHAMIMEFVKLLVNLLEAKDAYTAGHSERLHTYSGLIAKAMALTQAQQEALEIGVYLHDIGMLAIDTNILYKKGKYSPDELQVIREHPNIGYNLMSTLGFSSEVLSIIRHHHEYYNGCGYPSRIGEFRIPQLARIVTVVDSFDAMTTPRSYREPMSLDQVIKDLEKNSGSQFDPQIVDVFTKVLKEKGNEIMMTVKGEIKNA